MKGLHGLLWIGLASACGGGSEREVVEDPICGEAPAIEARRSLIVTDVAVLDAADFSLRRVLRAFAQQAHSRARATDLFAELWDTQNRAPGATGGGHCDDELLPGDRPGINGFPIRCDRFEGVQASAMLDPNGITPREYLANYRPIALVNRFDLAPADGSNCGEYRIIWAKTPDFGSSRDLPPGFGPRALIIMEAKLPNPAPTCGLAACRPVQRMWASLSSIDEPEHRAELLEHFYFQGVGRFAPVVDYHHFLDAEGTGQFRTNQFMQPPWVLEEFKTAECELGVCFVRTSVKTNPFVALFDGTVPSSDSPLAPIAADFQTAFIDQIASLAADDLASISMSIAEQFDAGQSESQGPDNRYDLAFARDQGASDFRAAIQAELARLGSALTPDQIVQRAETQSCAGCHQLSLSADLGGGLLWPQSRFFVHVDERAVESGPDGDRFPISPALTEVFLPARRARLENFLESASCERCGPR